MTRSQNLVIDVSGELGGDSRTEIAVVLVVREHPELSSANDDIVRVVRRVLDDNDFEAKEGSTLLINDVTQGGVRRLLLVGLGDLESVDPTSLRRAAATAMRRARGAHVRRLSILTPTCLNDLVTLGSIADGMISGAYDNGFYKKSDGDDVDVENVTIVSPVPSHEREEAVRQARIVSEAANWTRALTDEPGGTLPPKEFAKRAGEMAEEFGLTVQSLTLEEVRAQGMGGLLGVGQGSENEPVMIVVRYEPELSGDSTEELLTWAFVGKGITFDTGGISLKKALGMEEMKSDMAGGAAALGALRAIAQLKPRHRVIAIVPSAENMPSGNAIKPGDVIRTHAGFTIEVVDTDAEGRLVLVDGISYAKHLGATRIVDLATLTGSIIVALGTHRTGLFSNDDQLADAVSKASERAGEPAWRMPVSDDYKKKIESSIADFKNYGGKPDAVSAALLLSKFAGDTPWVHLDIAGTSWYENEQPFAPKGASGTAVRTLVELVCV